MKKCNYEKMIDSVRRRQNNIDDKINSVRKDLFEHSSGQTLYNNQFFSRSVENKIRINELNQELWRYVVIFIIVISILFVLIIIGFNIHNRRIDKLEKDISLLKVEVLRNVGNRR